MSIISVTPKKTCAKRSPKKPRRVFAAVAAAIAAFAVLGWIFARFHQADAHISYIGNIPVVQSYLPKGSSSRPSLHRTIKYIVIHETDNFKAGADAKAHNDFLLSQANTQELSWHYTVDDHEIYHNLPDDEAAYHASDHLKQDGGNLNGIGIELCVNEDGDYEKTLENGVQLVAKLLHEYNLSVEDVKKHQDFSGKICPARLIENKRWDEFLHRVRTAYAQNT